MPARLCWLCCVLLIFSFVSQTLAQAPAEPEMQQGPTVEQAEEQVRKIREALKDPSAPPETWGMLMMAEAVLLQARRLKEVGDAPADETMREQQRALSQRILAEWKAARPDDPTPYLSEMQGTVPPEQMDDAVLSLLPRFPDNPRLLGRVLPILSRREQGQRATELIEGALERHPERPDLYPVALGFYQRLNNTTRQQELAEAWIERMPGDAGAMRWWLSQNPASRDPRKMQERVERFVTAGGSDAPRVEVCGSLLTAENGAYRDAAVRCLLQASEQARNVDVRMRAAGFLASASSDAGEMARALAELPPERRRDAVLNAVYGLGEEQCPRKMSLLALLPWDGSEAGGKLSTKLSALHGCEDHEPARAAYLEALAQTPAEDLGNALSAWFIRSNGRFLDDHDLGPKMVAVLEERLKRQRDRAEVWGALATAYELADYDERRAAHLTAWLESDLTPPGREQLVWLGSFRAGQDLKAGVETFRRAWRETQDLEIAAELANLLLTMGKMDDFAAFTAELAGAEPLEERKEPPGASLARLLRARAALVRQGPQAALPEYQAWIDRVTYLNAEEADEYLMVVAAASGAPAAESAARAVCARDILSDNSSPSQCAATLLDRAGQSGGALQLLEAAAQRSPEDLELQSRFAVAAEQAGALDRAEAAFRRVLAVDPKSETGWMGLGRIAEKRGDPAELEALLRQSERALGDRPDYLVLALARSYRAKGQAARAVEVLTALRERRPGAYRLDEELRQSYEALGSEAPVSSPRGAPSSAALPGADDLRAQREAEAALLGLNGTVDEAKGREMVKALAQKGNVYANVRLSVWQQAGTQGFTANPHRAAATAAPYLPALRAAAESGEPFAQYLWGTVLLRGISVAKQAEEGGVWLQKAAEKGEPWALHNLGYMAEHGDGANPNPEEALRWYRRGAEAGNPFSMVSLATLRLNEDSPVRDPAEGVQWLVRAAERDLPTAVSWYAALQLYGLPGVAPDPVRARPWLEKAAALGEPRGLFDLAASLLMGLGGPPDEVRAVKLLEQAGERGVTRAFWQLAWQATLGRGTLHDGKAAEVWIERAAALGSDLPEEILGAREDDAEPARRWFASGIRALEKLAASGDPYAGGLLARLYSGGYGVPEDDARAVALARPAAAGGSTEAMRVLGWAYESGEGVEADRVQATEWRRRGAEAGHSYSMMWYSQRLFGGEGVEKDPVAALSWLERSGERGNYWAVRDLGHLYDEGWHGIPRDERKAEYWKRKALAFNDEEARGWLLARGLIE